MSRYSNTRYSEATIIEKEDILLTGIACYSLTQLKLLSMVLEVMLSLLILLSRLQIYFQLITFKYMLLYITKGYAEIFLHLRKWLTKSTHLNQLMWLLLRCALRYLNSEANIANAKWHPGFSVHPIQVSVRFLIAIESL